MSLLKSLYKSELSAAKMQELLEKVKILSTERANRFVLERGHQRFRGGVDLTAFTIDETAATGTILATVGSEYGVSASSAIIQDLTYTAKQVGDWYANNVTIEYADPGATPPGLSVDVQGRKIVVTLDANIIAAQASVATTTPIVLTSVAGGSARNTETLTTQVLAAAANPTDTVLVDFTGTAGAITCTVTPNDGTNNGATPVDLTTAELVELINSGAVVGKNITLTDASAFRALQTATGGDATAMADSGEGDGVVGTFSGGSDSAFVTDADAVKALIDGDAAASALVSVAVSGAGSNVQAVAAEAGLTGGSNQMSFDKADIIKIRRLRTKKWLVKLNSTANPA